MDIKSASMHKKDISRDVYISLAPKSQTLQKERSGN